jgi:hypothetical protein
VPSQDELPLGDDAIELVREPAADEPTDLDVEHTVEVPDPTADTADADWMAAADSPTLDSPAEVSDDRSGDGSGYLAGSSSDDQRDAGAGALPDAEPAAAPPAGEVDDTTDAGPGTEPVADAPAVDAPAPPKKKSRSSVPSWDEIMFGGGKSE